MLGLAARSGSEASLAAQPYVHEEVEAEPYIHEDVPCVHEEIVAEPDIYNDGFMAAAKPRLEECIRSILPAAEHLEVKGYLITDSITKCLLCAGR